MINREVKRMKVANQIDEFLNSILLISENQHEVLIGSCTSGFSLTNTQEHILMLLSKENYSNSELAKLLNVSQAAVTKAVKQLLSFGMLEALKDENDARIVLYRLTDLGRPVAEEHSHHHEHTLEVYNQVLSNFSEERIVDLEKQLNTLLTSDTVISNLNKNPYNVNFEFFIKAILRNIEKAKEKQ